VNFKPKAIYAAEIQGEIQKTAEIMIEKTQIVHGTIVLPKEFVKFENNEIRAIALLQRMVRNYKARVQNKKPVEAKYTLLTRGQIKSELDIENPSLDPLYYYYLFYNHKKRHVEIVIQNMHSKKSYKDSIEFKSKPGLTEAKFTSDLMKYARFVIDHAVIRNGEITMEMELKAKRTKNYENALISLAKIKRFFRRTLIRKRGDKSKVERFIFLKKGKMVKQLEEGTPIEQSEYHYYSLYDKNMQEIFLGLKGVHNKHYFSLFISHKVDLKDSQLKKKLVNECESLVDRLHYTPGEIGLKV
jgi:hypothetical protein